MVDACESEDTNLIKDDSGIAQASVEEKNKIKPEEPQVQQRSIKEGANEIIALACCGTGAEEFINPGALRYVCKICGAATEAEISGVRIPQERTPKTEKHVSESNHARITIPDKEARSFCCNYEVKVYKSDDGSQVYFCIRCQSFASLCQKAKFRK